MHPTASPTMMEMFLRNGEPKSSTRIIETNERKPRPMNSGEPHLARRVYGQYEMNSTLGGKGSREGPWGKDSRT